jgi:hypothetical protein
MSPYGHPVQKANRARPIVIADGEINPAMWYPGLAIVRQSKVRAARPHRLRAIGELDPIIRQGLIAVVPRGAAVNYYLRRFASLRRFPWKLENLAHSRCLSESF